MRLRLPELSSNVVILDGPVGTELGRLGVDLHQQGWSASAAVRHPDLLAQVHRSYAQAGATVHTANTFRTTSRAMGPVWREWLSESVRIARASVPSHHRVAGSIAPLEDCYQPERSPPKARSEHRMMAQELAASGVDLILCETFPHTAEARIAVEEAVATGLETWVAFTAGPSGNLLTAATMREGAEAAVDAGARAVLVNCVAASRTLAFVQTLAGLAVPVGAYANAGSTDGGWTWGTDEAPTKPYLEHARQWVQAGAELIGSCCGTGPATIAELHSHLMACPSSYRISSHD